jgi:hypothetical protein
MAAAIIPLVATAIGAIGPQIPSIVQMVENLFGHSSQTNKPAGTDKMQLAVTIGQAVLTGLANTGKIPSAPVVDPSLPAGLAGAIQQAVDAMKAAGKLNGATDPGLAGLDGTFGQVAVQKTGENPRKWALIATLTEQE